MSTSRVGNRPRAKNFKTELLLREVERRSVPHIVRLSQDGWPSDHQDGALAVRVVLELLKHEPVPSRSRALRSDVDSSEARETIDMIRAATTTIFKPFLNHFQSRGLGEVNLAALRSIEGNVSTLVRWLDFMSRDSSWLFGRWGLPQKHTNGPMFAALCLQTIYTLGNSKLRAEMEGCPQTVDLLLYLWSWQDPNGRTLQYRFLVEANGEACPALITLYFITKEPIALVHLVERLQAFSRSQYLRFIGSALDRLEEWAILQLEPKPLAIMRLLQLMQVPLDVPEYAAWYARCGFSPKILCVAKRFPHLRACGKYGGQLLPLPVAVATYLFPLETHSAILSYRSLPELLNAGLLGILVDYLLSLPESTAHPWYPWAGEDVKYDLGEPTPVLVSMCVYRPILDAVRNAKSRISQEKLDRLNEAWYRDHWSVYLPTLSLYERVWQAQDDHRGQVGGLAMCDNLNHHIHERGQFSLAKECENCRNAVYCSEECQREDWATFHRLECPGWRHYRIVRQIEADSVSHRYRAFLLALLHHAIFSYEVGVRSETMVDFISLDGGSKLAYYEQTMPPMCNYHKARVEATKDAIIHFSTLYCPTKFHIQSIQCIRGIAHGSDVMFHEDRFTSLFDEAQNIAATPQVPAESGLTQRIRLALCSVFCGSYRIWVLGRFLVTRNEKERTVTVQKLNGYVKIEERSAMNRSNISFVPDCVVQTTAAPCADTRCLCRESFII